MGFRFDLATIGINKSCTIIFIFLLKLIPSHILRCPKSAVGSFKREVWLYDKVNKNKISLEKLEINDRRTLLCQFDDVDGMSNQNTI